MRPFGPFVITAIVLSIALLFPALEPAVEALAAISFVAAIAYGFVLHPHTDVFYIRTTVKRRDRDRNIAIEHNQLAVRVETARLGLLFVPTAIAVGFLTVNAASGHLWHVSVLSERLIFRIFPFGFNLLNVLIYLLGIAIWTWISERRVMRNAEACSARSFKITGRRVGFQFVTEEGRYSGGDDLYFGSTLPLELATLVFYDADNIDLCKIAMSFLFHKIVIVGRGLAELDRATVLTRTVVREIAG